MRGSEFAELTAFLEIAERRSFAKASASLAITPSALSQTLKKLESRLGLVLVHRTTRSVSLTDAGAQLAADVRGAVDTLTRATNALEAHRDGSRGNVSLTASRLAADVLLAPRLAELRSKLPLIALEIDVNNRFIDVVAERIDIGIRRGEFLHAGMIATRLTQDERFVAVAAPTYLAKAVRPEQPSDLAAHDCIRLRALQSGRTSPWRFHDAGRLVEQRVDGKLVVNDARLALDAALAGLGIAFLAESFVRPSVDRGELAVVLERWAPLRTGYFVYHFGRTEPRAAVRSVLSFLVRPGVAG